MKSFLDADVYLYPAEEGGRHTPVIDGFRCPCFTEKDAKIGGWDCIIRIEGQPLQPGHHRCARFTFLSGEGATNRMRAAGKFYLWEGRFIGEVMSIGDDETDVQSK